MPEMTGPWTVTVADEEGVVWDQYVIQHADLPQTSDGHRAVTRHAILREAAAMATVGVNQWGEDE